MRNDIYRAWARGWLLYVSEVMSLDDSDPIMSGSTHPVGVPMADGIPFRGDFTYLAYNQIYVYKREEAPSQMNRRGEW